MTNSAEKCHENDGSVRFPVDRTAMGYRYRQIAGHLAMRISTGELTMNHAPPAEIRGSPRFLK
jgi:hypothetical protein